ncbi:MAG: serpin family protein [Deltaproteobacteria bacterium]|nr:serpin family protein [Deltaproteobacteria bacterium]
MLQAFRLPWLLVLVGAGLALAGCSDSATPSGSTSTTTAGVQVYSSQKARLTAASVPNSDVQAAAGWSNSLGASLYGALKDAAPSGNLMFSPYSAEIALAMTAQGAKGATATQMNKVLGFTLPEAQVHPALGALDLALTSRGATAKGKDDQPFRLKIANSTWGQKGYSFAQAFLDGCKVNYGANLNGVDFVKDAEAARLLINQWVLEATEKKIKDLIPKGAVDSLTRLVLVNAIYFNAAWMYPFAATATKDGPFTTLAGTTVTVPRMYQQETFAYQAEALWQSVALPYDGQELEMVVVLPAAGKLADVEALIASGGFAQFGAKATSVPVKLTLPRWKLDWSASLAKTLQTLGMTDAFDPAKADLSGIGGTKGELLITDVLQKTFVAVDEKGTEAAAATAVIVGTTGMPLNPVELVVDRPFLWLIRDVATGAVLFVGRVADPSQAQ